MFLEEKLSHFNTDSWPYESSPSIDDRIEPNDHVDTQCHIESKIVAVADAKGIVIDYREDFVVYIVAISPDLVVKVNGRKRYVINAPKNAGQDE